MLEKNDDLNIRYRYDLLYIYIFLSNSKLKSKVLICILLIFGEHGISSLLLHDFLLLIWLEPIKNTAEWFWACTGTWANELGATDGCCTREYPFWLGSTHSLGELKFLKI